MDWTNYKRLCERPDTWSRWVLEQTCELLDAALAQALRAAMAGEPVAKPADHNGGSDTDMFVLRLGAKHRRAVLDAVRAARDRGQTTLATRSRGLGGFVEAWREYVDWPGHRPEDCKQSEG